MTDETDLPGRLAERVVPLNRAGLDGGFEDLRPLADAFEDRQIVGLGEATHGTREFFELKCRIVRFLVTELDVRVLGLEANFAEARPIDEYVVSGKRGAEAAVNELSYWTWRTESVLALVEWLRRYNEGLPPAERVRFYGYDVRSTRGPARALAEFLERVDPGCLNEIEPHLTELEADWIGRGQESTAEQVLAARTVASDLADRFERHGDAYRSAVGDRDWRLAKRHRRLIEQTYQFVTAALFDDRPSPNAVRDAAMAENVHWILDYERSDRMALWAHNGHVTTGSGTFGNDGESSKPMGHHLKREYGDRYYAVGFEFGRGTCRAVPDPESVEDLRVGTRSIEAPPDGSVPAVLEDIGEPVCFLDLSSTPDDPVVREWVERAHRIHNVGAVHRTDPEGNYASVVLGRAFDGLVFVARTEPTVPVGRH